ncbi:MAG TPA: arginine repressor [Thermoanaerobacterales bacterium]|nr:arginine repressor [Thermoanaerobacterales bacterium]
MKLDRHSKILEIIAKTPIETQSELAELLKEQGFHVTQATVSRDIKELRLIKVLTDDNRYKYALPDTSETTYISERLVRLFKESITGFDYSNNLIVIKTLTGAANAAAAAIDALEWNEIVGTIAGDDTILVIARYETGVSKLLDKFNNLMSK